MPLPKISIVIPTFNMAPLLEQCLRTIAKQNYPQLEVLIIDGLSSDNTSEIVDRYSHLVTTFISEKDKGQPDAVTKGLKLASGEIVHWHAADDILLPNALHQVASAFDRSPSTHLVFSDGTAFGDFGIVKMETYRWVNFWDTFLFFGRFQSDSAYWRHDITPQALPLNNEMPLNCDEDFFLRLWVNRKFQWIAHPLGAFRLHGKQISQTVDNSNLERDRSITRQNIQAQQGWSDNQIALWRRQRRPLYEMNKHLTHMHKGTRFVARKITLDVRRKSYAKWLLDEWITK